MPQVTPPGTTSTEAQDLAKDVQNPVSDLIAIPFQNVFDFGIGPDNDYAYTLSIQPVIPVSLTDDWNIINRVLLPIIYRESDDTGGLGDTVAQFFFSPKEPWRGWIWGAGPLFLIPTATDSVLGTKKWGAGPVIVVLQQRGPWTAGTLLSQTWSFAGDRDRPDVNASFLQPFVAYTTQTATTAYIETETTYDWTADQWLVPIEPTIAQILPIGSQYIDVELGPTFYVVTPRGGPDWGLRVNFALLFPR